MALRLLANASFFSGRIPHCLGETARLRRRFVPFARHTCGMPFAASRRIAVSFFHVLSFQSLGDCDAERIGSFAFVPAESFLVRLPRRLSLHSRRSPSERAPSTAPSIASRCFAQKRPRRSAGSIHGIHRSGETLDGVNAAQWLSFTVNLT